MLSLSLRDRRPQRDCQGVTRRDWLRIGSLALGAAGLGGTTWPSLLSSAAAKEGTLRKDHAVVLLFLQGGPSHIEFFDPKMSAPEEFRSVTGEIATKIPGVTFGSTFTRLAQMTDRFSIVRSFGSQNTDHQNYLSVAGGGTKLKSSMGSFYSRVVGTTHPQTGVPTNVCIKPEAVAPGLTLGQNFETKALPGLLSPGELGPAYAAFDPSGGGELQKNLSLQMSSVELQDRRALLTQLDGFQRQMDRTGVLDGFDSFQQQAYDVLRRGVAEAFDLSREDAATIARYDTSSLFRQQDLQRWGDMRRTTNLLGRQMLLARRLCEAGCGFVTVADAGWDMHANGNSPKQMTGMWPMTQQVDHAVAAFLDDVRARGLNDRILLIVTGEMGRTPRINKNGGRDHYGELTPLLLAGGGLKMGQIVGASDHTAAKPATKPYTPKHLLATVMHTLFDVGKLRVDSTLPRNAVQTMTDGEPILELV